MLKGIPVTLMVKTQTGVDPASRPIYSWEPVTVENVLVAPASDDEVLSTLNLTGRRAEYVLGIPKTDAHTWEGQRVRFFGETWEVIGIPTKGIDDLIPGPWNKKVKVERFGKAEN